MNAQIHDMRAAIGEFAMQESRSRLTDDLARMFNDAAGLANGVRREVETLVRTQMERMLSKMDVVGREEFEAVRDMAALAREENEKLEKRIAELEAKLAGKSPVIASGAKQSIHRDSVGGWIASSLRSSQ